MFDINSYTMNNKLFVLAFFVVSAHIAAAILPAGPRVNWMRTKWMCMDESGAEPEDFDNFVKGTEPDRKLKCYTSCMAKIRGNLNEDGTLNVERSIENVPEDHPDQEQIIEAYNSCAETVHDDECEMAHMIFTCLAEKKVFNFLFRTRWSRMYQDQCDE